MNAEQTWQKVYLVAALETDWSKMEDRIRAAETAIEQRVQELNLDHGGTPEENLAILATVQKLIAIRGDLARWSESKQPRSDTRTVSD